MKFLAAALFAALTVGQPVLASEDPLVWLSRIASAANALNYSGTFIYQSGPISETSRITHFVDASGEHERLEVLDGSPRQVIRNNDEVWCVFPDRKTVIADRSGTQRSFPARLPTALNRITENYEVRKGKVSRVAGFDAQLVVLAPRDGLRYGHKLWADVNTGLLLKALMVDESGAIIEQFMFSDVRIGEGVKADTTRPSFGKEAGWKVVAAHGSTVGVHDSGWSLAVPLAGYALESVVRRQLGKDQRDVLHMVFSDGLASISVFIEPLDRASAGDTGPLTSGAINIYRREVSGHLLTALGEVPMQALRGLGDAMEQRPR
jgi:sigma-E factor negative regulatory protein RseB